MDKRDGLELIALLFILIIVTLADTTDLEPAHGT